MILQSVDQKRGFVQGKGVAGIDVAEGWHYVQWLRPDGRPQGRPFRVANNREGFAQILAHRPTAEVVIGLESTGVYWHPLAQWLAQQPGVTVVLVNPAHVHRVKARDDNRPTKSDPKDAGVIARLVAQGRWLGWTRRDAVWAELRTLAIVRQQQRTEVTRWENRIPAWFAQYFPEFPTVFKDWRGKAAQWVLRHAPLPADCVAQGVAALAAGMLAAARHRVGRKRVTALVAVAAQSIGVSTGVEPARYPLQTSRRGWRWARAALARTEARQRELVAQTGYGDVLRGLPGFGPVVVATLLGWLGDLTRFADPRQALKMAGLNLTQQSSGHHQGATHISKRGQPAVRCALYQAAVVAMAKDAGWRAWYQRLVQRAKNPLPRKAALLAVACKLLRVAWACARQQTPDDAHRLA